MAFGPLEPKAVLSIASSSVGAGTGESPWGRGKQGSHVRCGFPVFQDHFSSHSKDRTGFGEVIGTGWGLVSHGTGVTKMCWYFSEYFAVVNTFKPHDNLGEVPVLQRR